jgi:hypothetical protein
MPALIRGSGRPIDQVGPERLLLVASGKEGRITKGAAQDIFKLMVGRASETTAGDGQAGRDGVQDVTPARGGTQLRVQFATAEHKSRMEERLRSAGLSLAGAGVRRRKVILHGLPEDTTLADIKNYLDYTLERVGEPKVKDVELSCNPKAMLAKYGRPEADSGLGVVKGYLYMAERVRRAVHRAGDRLVRPDNEYATMRLEDHVAPIMCYRCCRYGHTARACQAPAPRCASCNGVHEMRTCSKSSNQATRAHCGACGQQGHRAYEHGRCPTWQAAYASAQLEVANFLSADPSLRAQW